jgi:hypothetical protein
MTDPVTGEQRPKKRPGRRSRAARVPSGKTPSIEELQSLGTLSEASEDTAPGVAPKVRLRGAAKPKPDLPPFRAGVIAKGVNRLYRRAGRIARMMHYDIGTAIIASATRPKAVEDDPEDDDAHVTVGEAWENLAKQNPRVRAFLLKAITGGIMGDMFMSHLPILMAVAMTDTIRRRLPVMDLVGAFLTEEPEDGGDLVASPMAQAMGGIGPEDMAQMMQMAQGLMGQMANGVPRPASTPRDPNLDQV